MLQCCSSSFTAYRNAPFYLPSLSQDPREVPARDRAQHGTGLAPTEGFLQPRERNCINHFLAQLHSNVVTVYTLSVVTSCVGDRCCFSFLQVTGKLSFSKTKVSPKPRRIRTAEMVSLAPSKSTEGDKQKVGICL